MSIPRADRKLMREMNSTQVLQRIRAYAPISRPELSEQTGLSLSTISNIVGDLLENGLVQEVGEGDSTGGRRPSLLDINESARYSFGVKIGPGTVWLAVFNLRGREVMEQERTFYLGDAATDVILCISEAIEDMRRQLRLSKPSILGVGVSVSGLVNSNTGECVFSPILHWEHVQVGEQLRHLTKLDVVVENDVNAFTLGSLLSEVGSDTTNMICITTGPGVGAGIVIDRRLYRGSHGGAGEFGHVSIDKNGPLCQCGRRGCLDVLGSDQYLLWRGGELTDSASSPIFRTIIADHQLTPSDVFHAAQVGDETALTLFRELGENLGLGVANLINLFNPDKIIVGGEGAIAASFFMETLRDTAIRSAFPHLADNLEICVDDGSEVVWLQGAAALVIERFFELTMQHSP